MNAVAAATDLRSEARAVDERRGLVLAGDRDRGYDTLEAILGAVDVPITNTVLVGSDDRLRCEHRSESRARDLLGTTQEIVIVDAHEGLQPNTLGQVVGTVDAGGLFVLLTPPLERWPDRRGTFAESMAVPPYSLADVTGHFRRRLVRTLRAHRGIGIVDVDADRVVDEGLTRPAPRLVRGKSKPGPEAETVPEDGSDDADRTPRDRAFPGRAYDACLTDDQRMALAHLEHLLEREHGAAVVLEADRGRGKSSAVGLAAACLAARGDDVVITAPSSRNAAEAFGRATSLLESLGERPETERDTGDHAIHAVLTTERGGSIGYESPLEAVERAETRGADVVLVDEAAALSVGVLESLLAADRIAFATTIHGYEGAGRGFSVRFRDRLERSDHDVVEYTLVDPIRYAGGDPLEVWAFHALLLDARPPVAPIVEEATPETVTYRRLDAGTLVADEPLLREVFGLLVLAHYRTEPNDLARLLDAPNLEARALLHDGRVVSVALLAREGDLDADNRALMYEGGRIRGNMIPDVLTSHLRDEDAGALSGIRVVRIATHHAARSRGLGTTLLDRIEAEFAPDVDWLGTGFGATPELVSFWARNGYRTVHLSTTRNDTSGEHSAILLASTSPDGDALLGRHGPWFARRLPVVLSDTLRDLDPDIVRAVARSIDVDDTPPLECTDREWAVVAGAAYGPGLFDVDPDPFRRLVCHWLIDRARDDCEGGTVSEGPDLDPQQERLLVRRVLQAQPWDAVTEDFKYHSSRTCMRAFGDALVPLVDRYGTDAAEAVKERFHVE